MKDITEITRRDIIELFREGYVEYFWGGEIGKIFYPYYGRLDEIEFIEKLYPPDKVSEFNNDRKADRIFEDSRFELLRGSDLVFLNFLCAVFHPENRNEKGYWKEYLEKINSLIKADGYELYENNKISGRAVYSWRKITPEEAASGKFIPFSRRYGKEIENKAIIIPKISKKVRKEFLEIFIRHDEIQYRTSETNWSYSISAIEALREDIRNHYKTFDSAKKYSETDNLEQFIMNSYPYCVFDAVELFAQYDCHNGFVDEINRLFQNRGFNYRLSGGKIEIVQIYVQTKETVGESGLRELIEQATSLYNSGKISDKQFAIEKLWDAFERLKTYYSTLDKKKSVEKLVDEISGANDKYRDLFNDEFQKLTYIGNHFRIRHHETDKVDIIDNNYYNYFFQRCIALIDLTLKYLK